MFQTAKKFFEVARGFLLELLFPQLCLGCQKEGSYLCSDCLALIDFATNYQKEKNNQALAGLYFATDYNHFLVQRLIQNFKYPPFAKKLAKTLGSLIIIYFRNLEKPVGFLQRKEGFVFVPIPAHPARWRWRGFNPATEIARELSDFFQIPLSAESLVKIKKTPPQTELTEQERCRNLKGAFACLNPDSIQGKKVLLVDDVSTTGSTLREAAGALKTKGAKEVWAIAVAKG